MRLLFVDDEPEIQRGLRRVLSGYDSGWGLRFASSGAEGLKLLEEAPADVVVSDMYMPRMDGIRFLEQVRERYPNTIRMILSGQSDERSAIRALNVAHQFLGKPVAPQQLRALIQQTAALIAMMQDEQMRTLIGNVSRLPLVPRVYQAVSKAVQDPESTTSDIVRLVQQEPAMSAKILQIANSAFFALRSPTSELKSAVVQLGMNTICHLVLAAEVFDPQGFAGTAEPENLERLRDQALRTAQVAEYLATSNKLGPEAFTMGLLANIGQFVLALTQGEAWRSCRRRALENGVPMEDEESLALGTSHAEVGGFLLGIWGLPFAVVEAVSYHHHPERTASSHLGPAAITAIATAFVEGTELEPEWMARVGGGRLLEQLRSRFPEVACA